MLTSGNIGSAIVFDDAFRCLTENDLLRLPETLKKETGCKQNSIFLLAACFLYIFLIRNSSLFLIKNQTKSTLLKFKIQVSPNDQSWLNKFDLRHSFTISR